MLGRYVCTTFEEATASGPFDVVVLGGGTFGLALAQDLFFRAKRFDAGAGGDAVTVALNGVDTARYTNTDPHRGRFRPDKPTFVGRQSYSDYSATAAFRDIRITALATG